MNRYWVKLPHEILATPGIARLRDRLWRRYIECLIFASKVNKGGALLNIDDMAWMLQCEVESLETELFELAEIGLLSILDGRYYVHEYDQMQAPSKHAQYMREWREKKKRQNEKEEITR